MSTMAYGQWLSQTTPCGSITNFDVLSMHPFLDGDTLTDPTTITIMGSAHNTPLPAGAISGTIIDLTQLTPGTIYSFILINNTTNSLLVMTNFSVTGGLIIDEPYALSVISDLCEDEGLDLNTLIGGSTTTGQQTAWTSTDANVSFTGTGSDQFNYSYSSLSESIVVPVTLTLGTGACVASETFNLTIHKIGDANWTTSPTVFCVGDPAVSLLPNNPPLPGQNPIWSSSPATAMLTDNSNSATLDPTTALNFDVIYTVGFSGGGCRNSVSRSFQVLSALSASFDDPGSMCDRSSLDLDGLVTGGTVGTFTSNAGIVSGTGANTTLSVSGMAGDTISIFHSVGSGGCAGYDTQTVVVNAIPDSSWDLTQDYLICETETGNLFIDTNLYINARSTSMIFSSTDSGVVIGSNNSYFIDPTQMQCNTDQEITFLATNDGGCSASSSVNFRKICLDTSWTAPGPFCLNDGIQDLEILATVSEPGGVFFSSGGSSLSNNKDFDPSGGTQNDIIYTLISIEDVSCSLSSAPQTIRVLNLPNLDLAVNDTLGCVPLEINFDVSASTDYSSISIDFGDGNSIDASAGIGTHVYPVAGNYSLTLSASNVLGSKECSTSLSGISIEGVDPPQALGTPDNATIYVGGNILFSNSSLVSAPAEYGWDVFSSSYYTVADQSPQSHSYNTEGNFEAQLWAYYTDAELSNDAKCRDSILIPFEVTSQVLVYFPNAFTPTGDNLNEVFRPIGSLTSADQYDFRIFDRWGKTVFETTDKSQGWSGVNKNGVDLNGGLYTYVLKIVDNKGEKLKYQGTVLLLR